MDHHYAMITIMVSLSSVYAVCVSVSVLINCMHEIDSMRELQPATTLLSIVKPNDLSFSQGVKIVLYRLSDTYDMYHLQITL